MPPRPAVNIPNLLADSLLATGMTAEEALNLTMAQLFAIASAVHPYGKGIVEDYGRTAGKGWVIVVKGHNAPEDPMHLSVKLGDIYPGATLERGEVIEKATGISEAEMSFIHHLSFKDCGKKPWKLDKDKNKVPHPQGVIDTPIRNARSDAYGNYTKVVGQYRAGVTAALISRTAVMRRDGLPWPLPGPGGGGGGLLPPGPGGGGGDGGDGGGGGGDGGAALDYDDDDAPQPPAPPPPPPEFVRIGGGGGGSVFRLPVSELCLGTLLVGSPGSGKTQMLKHVIEAITEQMPGMRNVVMLDYKGDLSQLIQHLGDAEDDPWHVEVMTFGTKLGERATLEVYAHSDALDALDFDEDDPDKMTAVQRQAQQLVAEVLIGTQRHTKSGHATMQGGHTMEAMWELRGTHGVNSVDSAAVANTVTELLNIVVLANKADGNPAPRSCADWTAMVETYLGVDPRCTLRSALVTKDDVRQVLGEVYDRANPFSRMAALYKSNRDGALRTLTGKDLFAAPPAGKTTRVVIVNLGFLPSATTKQRAAAVLLPRIGKHVEQGIGGSQDDPRALLVLDEAALLMPDGRKETGDSADVAAAVEHLLRRDRDKGCGLLLATQRAQDLVATIRSQCTGARLLGTGNDSTADKKAILDNIARVNKGADRKRLSEALEKLPPHAFVALSGNKTCKSIKAGPLKRMHESSAPWLLTNESNPLHEHVAKRRRLMGPAPAQAAVPLLLPGAAGAAN